MKRLAGRLKRIGVCDNLIRRPPFVYGHAFRLARRLEQADLEERRAFTAHRLRAILSAAAKTRYGRKYAGKPIEEWPYLDRDQVRDNPGDFVLGPAWLGSCAATTGTSGVPLQLCRSLRNVVNEQVRIDTLFLRSGIDPYKAKVAVLRGDDIKSPADTSPPYWILANAGKRLVFSSNHLNSETIPFFHRALAEYAPDCIAAYPTMLASLCGLLRRFDLRLRVPLVLCSSEVLTTEAWHAAQEVLGAKVVDYYGQAERVAFAAAFQPETFTFVPGYAYVELLPAGEEPGAKLYEVAGTNLWNTKMPLVRYRTGDLLRLPNTRGPWDAELLTHGLQAFPGIIGRQGDYLIRPDGAPIMGIDHIPRSVDHVLRTQVIQEDLHTVRILVLPGPGFSEVQVRQLLHNASIKIPPEMKVNVEVVEQLEQGSGAKTPFVIRRFEAKQPV
ncbi:MAG: capsular polysaccharide biosynthesis protein CapK [Fimbriimonadales bacterium]|nr:MAG: capsular polysaccharide biosynthesis protein CapK [Fimbriimonadales bacterium]